jgi:hypothetical protein
MMQHKFKDGIDMGGGVRANYKSQYWDGTKYIATYVIMQSPFTWQVGDEFTINSPVYDYVDDIKDWND